MLDLSAFKSKCEQWLEPAVTAYEFRLDRAEHVGQGARCVWILPGPTPPRLRLEVLSEHGEESPDAAITVEFPEIGEAPLRTKCFRLIGRQAGRLTTRDLRRHLDSALRCLASGKDIGRWERDFRSKCERQLAGVIEPHGFEYLGFKPFGRGGYCGWALPLAEQSRLGLRVWTEYDGVQLLNWVCGAEDWGDRTAWITRFGVLGMERAKARGEAPPSGEYVGTHLRLAGRGLNHFAGGLAELRTQIDETLPRMLEAFESERR